MAITTALVFGLALAQGPTAPSLQVQGKELVIRHAGQVHREPLQITPENPQKEMIYRKDDRFAVWDARGLSARIGNLRKTTRLPDIALTPKLFTADEISRTKDLMRAGIRTQAASGLSGSVRVGNDVFFLLRWDEKGGRPWLEALVKVNLMGNTAMPELVGRFQGRTLSRSFVDDKLFVMFGLLSALTVDETGGWGLATYQPSAGGFAFTEYGRGLIGYTQLSQRLFIVQEQADQGVRVARVDFGSGARRDLFESKDAVTLFPGEPVVAKVSASTGPALRNIETGAELALPNAAHIRNTKAGVLVWPDGKPQLAVLYDPERWNRIASVK